MSHTTRWTGDNAGYSYQQAAHVTFGAAMAALGLARAGGGGHRPLKYWPGPHIFRLDLMTKRHRRSHSLKFWYIIVPIACLYGIRTFAIPPRQFAVPFLHGTGRFPFHHRHPPIYNIKRSTVNVYEINRGRSVRVRCTVSATFQILTLTAEVMS